MYITLMEIVEKNESGRANAQRLLSMGQVPFIDRDHMSVVFAYPSNPRTAGMRRVSAEHFGFLVERLEAMDKYLWN